MISIEEYLVEAEKHMEKELKKLVGYTVVRPAFSHESNEFDGLYPGLVMRNKDGETATVWFLRDEEDNGAGYFDIQIQRA